METIPANISSKVLTVGPEYLNHRGGIGAVIETYSSFFEGFKFISSFKSFDSNLKKSAYFFKQLGKIIIYLLKDKDIKIVHIHGASRGSFYRKFLIFLVVKYLFKKKVLYHIHGGGYHIFYNNSSLIKKRAISFFINQCDCLVCLSHFWKSYFLQNFNARRIEVLPNVINHPKLTETGKNNIISFLFLGYITQQKGIFDLLAVIAKNKKKYTNRIKLMVGGNGESARLQEIIKAEDITGIVDFLGWVKTEEKEKMLNMADIYILPSYNEGLPVSILEAMAYEKPIIATDVGGISEIVFNKRNGILLEPGNNLQIEQAIDFFLENPEKIKDFGIESKQIIKNFLPDIVFKQLCNIYQSLL